MVGVRPPWCELAGGALVSVVATSYLLGVSTRRVEKLVEQLGVKQLSKSQVSQMAAHLDAQVEAFGNRPLDSGHYTFVWLDALVIKAREDGRTVNVHALIAVGVNADGGREVPGLDVCSDEDGAGWLALGSPPSCEQCSTSPDADAVRAQFDRAVDAIAATFPTAADHLDQARADLLAFTTFPREIWRQIWSNKPA